MANKRDIMKYVELMADKKRMEMNERIQKPFSIVSEVVDEILPEKEVCTPVFNISKLSIMNVISIEDCTYSKKKTYVGKCSWISTIKINEEFLEKVNEMARPRLEKAIDENIKIRDEISAFNAKIEDFKLKTLIYKGGELAELAKEVLK